jgi:cell division protease FtsH
MAKNEFKYLSLFKDYIFQLNGEEIVKLIKQIERKSCTAREMDFSKSLILVIGNLDEAFEMSGMVSADHDPDRFYEETKKITFSKIKEGLKERFRMEEISRLGNIHLIYPALNSQVFRKFIDKELKEIARRFYKSFECSLEFSALVKDTLFEEGVTASQGFRPLRSTIGYLIESSLSNLFQKMTFDSPQKVLVDMEEDDLVVKVHGIVEGRKTLHLPIRDSKRKKLAPQTLAITAVHEAGHALVYAAVFGKLPKMTTVTSSDYFSGGFVEGESMLDFDTYELIIRDIAVKMAGKKAEELVFGADHQITFGCKNDVQLATRILLEAVRSGVLPNLDVFFENPIHGNGRYLPETSNEMDWVKAHLEKGSQMAGKILKENPGAYRTLIKILLNKKTLNSTELSSALIEQGVNLEQILSSFPPLPDYKSRLEIFLSLD